MIERHDGDPKASIPLFRKRQPSRPQVVSIDGSIREGVRKALSGPEPEKTPAERMALEHLRLLEAFQGAEGRDPTPEDEEYWVAYNNIFGRGTADGRGGS